MPRGKLLKQVTRLRRLLELKQARIETELENITVEEEILAEIDLIRQELIDKGVI